MRTIRGRGFDAGIRETTYYNRGQAPRALGLDAARLFGFEIPTGQRSPHGRA